MNIKQKMTRVAVVSTAALATASAQAGAIADAVTQGTSGLVEDLGAAGAIVIGIVVVGVGIGAAIRMLRKGG